MTPLLDATAASPKSTATTPPKTLKNQHRSKQVIVPVIPRQLETRLRQASSDVKRTTINGGSRSDPVDARDGTSAESRTPDSVNRVQKSTQGTPEIPSSGIPSPPPSEEAPSQFLQRRQNSSQSPALHLPPPFYPSTQTPTESPLDSNISLRTPIDVSPQNQDKAHKTRCDIVFGQRTEYSESSPLSPSHYNQPAIPQQDPPSDAVPSTYHGYGYTHYMPPPSWQSTPPYFSPFGHTVPPTYNPQFYPPSIPQVNTISTSTTNWPLYAGRSYSNYGQPTENRVTSNWKDMNTSGSSPSYANQAFESVENGFSHVPTDGYLEDDSFSNYEDMKPLSTYLLNQFDNPTFSDCKLNIVLSHSPSKSFTLFVHSLLLRQNDRLSALLDSNTNEEHENKKVLQIETPDRFATPKALRLAVQTYYGLPLPQLNERRVNGYLVYVPNKTLLDLESGNDPMDALLSYAAAGQILSIPNVCQRGVDIASKMMSYYNIEKALSFAFEGRIGSIGEGLSQQSLDASSSDKTDSSDGRSNVLTPASSDRSKRTQDSTLPLPALGGPTYAPYSHHLLELLIAYIVFIIGESFVLDTRAKSCAAIDRLPVTAEGRSSKRRRPVNSMKFGQYTSNESKNPSDSDTAFSSVLISLPFSVFKDVTNRLDERLREKILKPLIAERERRRHLALRSKNVPGSQRQASLWEQVGWEEFVEQSSKTTDGDSVGSMLYIGRRWTGFEKPSGKKES